MNIVQELHPHKLRHSFASIAITNGADIASVSEILGHSDKAVTLRMYTHADQASMTRASNRACYEAMALGGNRVIREYLERLGVIDPAEPSLQEIARQMEENYGL